MRGALWVHTRPSCAPMWLIPWGGSYTFKECGGTGAAALVALVRDEKLKGQSCRDPPLPLDAF